MAVVQSVVHKRAVLSWFLFVFFVLEVNCYFEKKLASVCFCGNTAEYGIHVAEVALLVPVQTSVRFWKNL